MKRFFAPVVLLTTFLLLMGMGELGSPAGKVPTPEKNFRVRVTDREGVQTSLTEFSAEGKVFLAGKRGDATVTIPFEKISQVQFEPQEGNRLDAKVSLRGQETVTINLDKQTKFYAKTDFGTFQISAKDVKSLAFLP